MEDFIVAVGVVVVLVLLGCLLGYLGASGGPE